MTSNPDFNRGEIGDNGGDDKGGGGGITDSNIIRSTVKIDEVEVEVEGGGGGEGGEEDKLLLTSS
jgi:hypothetical protein